MSTPRSNWLSQAITADALKRFPQSIAGQAVFATSLTGGVSADDGNYALEGWYKFQVTDAISITPALFYLSRPMGQRTPEGQGFSSLGALVKTTFKF